MNYFKYVPSRATWYQLKRLQSSVTKIQIPPRKERGPTDILTALERTLPDDIVLHRHVYHDDPFLLPIKKISYRNFALSYESGKKTAMWIHEEHRDLFPKRIADPPIQAFEPPVSYASKKRASEETLLLAISECRPSDAVCIYGILETNKIVVSNTTKQALLELLCFYNMRKTATKDLPMEMWFKKDKLPFKQYGELIRQLYETLVAEDRETAVLAHNAMLRGYTKMKMPNSTFLLYKKCMEENIPLSVTSYNSIIKALVNYNTNKVEINIDFIYQILNMMNKNRVKPNVRTFNEILRRIAALPSNIAYVHMKHLYNVFKKLDIKFSLGSYHYILNIIAQKGREFSNDFMAVLHTILNEGSFEIQDVSDTKFFPSMMHLCSHIYLDRKIADMIHRILLTEDNHKFLVDDVTETVYYRNYLMIILSTSPISEFFEFYDKFIPNLYKPNNFFFELIIKELLFCDKEMRVQYVLKLWTDIKLLGLTDYPLKIKLISLIDFNSLSADSPLRSTFLDAAWDCWESIMYTIQERPQQYETVTTTTTGLMALTLLSADEIMKGVEVLKYSMEQINLFTPTMDIDLLNKLFKTCISKECTTGAFIILEYAKNYGFPLAKMVQELNNLPQLTTFERNKLNYLAEMREEDTSEV